MCLTVSKAASSRPYIGPSLLRGWVQGGQFAYRGFAPGRFILLRWRVPEQIPATVTRCPVLCSGHDVAVEGWKWFSSTGGRSPTSPDYQKSYLQGSPWMSHRNAPHRNSMVKATGLMRAQRGTRGATDLARAVTRGTGSLAAGWNDRKMVTKVSPT